MRAVYITRKQCQRLGGIVAVLVFAGLLVALIVTGLKSNMNLFLTPAEVHEKKPVIGRTFRLGGMVVQGSVERGADMETRFLLSDFAQTVPVVYRGILPDLFREGQGIVAEGHLNADRVFEASLVLAKHDEQYMPPRVAADKGVIP